ncbi:MAG TPA: DR2241 family protein [Chthoniobacterales bacterium]|nr:DR2241 family protein [Chthoniobacterales bacterium]
MSAAIEQALAAVICNGANRIGEIAIITAGNRFVLTHRDDIAKAGLATIEHPAEATRLVTFDDAGNFRPLKTAPNLRRGWRMELPDLARLASALDYFYPGRLAALATWQENRLTTTPLRESLNRQSGMYRVAAKISDEQIDNVVGNFCRSDGGCLRTILWRRDSAGATASKKLPPEKFDPAHDQTGRKERSIPLLCQEACNLLVNECRKAVKTETAAPSAPE